MPETIDTVSARELHLFIDNDGATYRASLVPAIANLCRNMGDVGDLHEFNPDTGHIGLVIEPEAERAA